MGNLTKKEDGIIILNGAVVATTKQCVHCGTHFIPVKGSGKVRGWCMKCHGVTCGALNCCTCVPFEKKLELIEKKFN
jgi:hypothetical protein